MDLIALAQKLKIAHKRNLIVLLGLSLVIIIVFTVKNIHLRAHLKELESPIKFSHYRNANNGNIQNDSDKVVIVTGEEGLWDKERKITIRINHELTIGHDTGDTNKVFYHASPVISDSTGNIYVAEPLKGTIKKFDANGNYLVTLGRKGRGPGEFIGIFNFLIEKDTLITVFDPSTLRISRFSLDGNFLGSLPLQIRNIQPPQSFKGVAIDDQGFYYLSFYDHDSEKIIHKFNSQGKHVFSFGIPLEVKEPENIIAFTLKKINAPGKLVANNDYLFFSQNNPYEIRKYTLQGNLKRKIIRKNSFMPPHSIKIGGGGAYLIKPPAHSSAIGIFKNLLINCVSLPPEISNDINTIVDFFSLDGQLLTSVPLKEKVYFHSIDRQGKLYGKISTATSEEHIVRYGIAYDL